MKFNIIYSDPPWQYYNKKTGGSLKSGAVQKYPLMTIEDIKSLPISEISEEDSILFLWATVPLLPEAIDTLEAWGFKYKTALFWDKDRYGLGFWFRGQIEMLLIGVKGSIKPFKSQLRNIIKIKNNKHSEKPVEFRQLINTLSETLNEPKKIELFARNEEKDWKSVGNEIDGKDIREVLRDLMRE